MFVRYFTAILIDLVVLNLFVEYSPNVSVDSFTTSLLAAVLLQVLLKLTIAIEHSVAALFQKRPGGGMKFLRFFFAWLVFGSKFVILEALTLVFGDKVRFGGAFHEIVTSLSWSLRCSSRRKPSFGSIEGSGQDERSLRSRRHRCGAELMQESQLGAVWST